MPLRVPAERQILEHQYRVPGGDFCQKIPQASDFHRQSTVTARGGQHVGSERTLASRSVNLGNEIVLSYRQP
jgi:hypothetical protein